MKKNLPTQSIIVISILLFISFKITALNYTVNFTGSGAATIVDSVIVQNLTQGTKVTVPAGNVLNLSDQTNAVDQLAMNNENLDIYPNGYDGKYTMTFYAKNPGVTQISVYSVDGRKIAGMTPNLQVGTNSFQLLLPKGLYAIQVSGNGYAFSTKMINQNGSSDKTGVTYLGTDNLIVSASQKSKSTIGVTLMKYTIGDLVLYKGKSGIYSTILTDLPIASKTINFDFMACTDASGYNYSVVKIGSQTWMAENLRTTKFFNGDDIINLTNNTDWGMYSISSWCSYNNDATNGTNPGKLYNWYAVADSRNIAPTGWHVATDDEWTMLTSSLGGESVSGGKLKETGLNHWETPNTSATNETGFTALPEGYRLTSGEFDNLGINGNWWSVTENGTNYAWYRYMLNGSPSVIRDYYNKNSGFSVRCVRDAELPTVTTAIPSSITYTTAVGGGSVTSDGGAPVTAKGVCWSLTANPTVSNSESIDGTGTGTFTSSITGLNINATYYVRAYATNSSGTSYGDQVVFNSMPYDSLTVTDADGNLYHTITIGTQKWMVENLKTTKYRNGDVIGTTSSLNMDLTYAISPKYQWAYNGLESNVPTYGRLYTWYVVADSRNIAPTGWHVASDAEWSVLQNYLIVNGYNYDKMTSDNKIAKSLCTTTLWNITTTVGTPGCNLTQNNTSGFSMVPGGYRGTDGNFYILGSGTDIWTSTENSTNIACVRGCGNAVSLGSNNINENYGFSARCIKNSLPIISTNTPSSILSTNVTCGGNITSDGGDTITAYGVCWSTNEIPTIADSIKHIGSGIGTFTSTVSGLNPNTTYYLRAYATNGLGTAYGELISFKTLVFDPLTVTDIDGNLYHTITIGKQTWMVENLKTTKYNDGTSIPLITDGYQWINLTSPAYSWANNDINSKDVYGALYNFYSISTGKLAPNGWHVPTDSDWVTLENYLGGPNISGAKMKESGTTHWLSPNSGATNESGFSALPGGYRSISTGDFIDEGIWGCWWSSTISNGSVWRVILTNTSSAFDYKLDVLNYGFSVKCIKN